MLARSLIHKLAIGAERTVDRFRGAETRPPVLDSYRGYATPDVLVVRGRVLAGLRRTTPDPTQSRWQNLREMMGLFFTDEVAGVAVHVPETTCAGVSDEEGYFTLSVPRGDVSPGWCEVAVEITDQPGSRVMFPVQVPSGDARLGVISDVDDTMIETGAYSLVRNLWTTFTGSALSRRVFPDSIVLMDHLHAHGRNPLHYVSSSPWNLHAFLDKVFDRAGLVAGPMFLRDLGISETQLITAGHGSHKGSAIDRIIGANPGLPFVMIGDTGQKDAHIYLAACERHGGRVRAVILREPGPGPDDESRRAIAAIRNLGVVVYTGVDFNGAAGALAHGGIEI